MVLKLSFGKGAEDLSPEEKSIFNKLTKEYFDKASKHVSNINLFEVHLKSHKKEGDTKRYSIEVKFDSGEFRFETSADEWNLNDAIHIAMKKLMSEIEHRIVKHNDYRTSWKKKAKSRFFS